LYGAEFEVVLVEELNPKVIRHERTPIEEGDQLHDGESAVGTGPERQAHYGWGQLSTSREMFAIKAPFEVVLPEEKGSDRKHTKNEEGDDVWQTYECVWLWDVDQITHKR
jgi:hypothetical protein